MEERFLCPSAKRPIVRCDFSMEVETRMMGYRHSKHVTVVVSVEVESCERPQSGEESEADSDCGNTFKHSGGGPGTPFAQEHRLTLGSN